MRAESVRRASNPVDSDVEDGGRATVLLVTGNATLRAAIAGELRAAGYDVVEAAHSGHALLRSLSGLEIDVLATELAMDDSSGPALAGKLRKHHPDLDAVFFPGNNTR